jgi:hypothetical protein
MKFPSITIQGSILTSEIVSKLSDGSLGKGQLASDFGLGKNDDLSEAIQRAWADANSLWTVFSHRREQLKSSETGTTQVRRFWMEPLLEILGYALESERKGEEVKGRTYPISHRDGSIGGFPVHIVGFQDEALGCPDRRSSLDVKPSSGARMSPHAMVQEYLNLTEHLYAIVTNGLQLRVLRDSSRLVKLSYLEFNLEQMMEEKHFADFRMLFRLLHQSRMPRTPEESAESLIEGYHHEALVSGEAIRSGLGEAVQKSIEQLGNGFLVHPANEELRAVLEDGTLTPKAYFQQILRLIYRLLFLMVIEERDLVYARAADRKKRRIYYDFYSVNRLRKLAESPLNADERFADYWEALKNTFRLFESRTYGEKLDIAPLGGELFGPDGIGYLANTVLDNKTLLESLRRLGVFYHAETKQIIRVNYASLNVEEFGSVYEGLLEYDASVRPTGKGVEFALVLGKDRSTSGSHYTPDELVVPLIKHSLDHLIAERLQQYNPEKALLELKVADIACGSGHILLAAARRIGVEIARVRTGDDQPSPEAQRHAIRDAIRHCIYGVDKNPMAVELCKVALWLEAHEPGAPLSFLDHHIRCGDAIVGLRDKKELLDGIPDAAFTTLAEDDATVRGSLAKRNKKERGNRNQASMVFGEQAASYLDSLPKLLADLDTMPEDTPEQVVAKEQAYRRITTGEQAYKLEQLANTCVANFWIPKTQANKDKILTDQDFRQLLQGQKTLGGQAVALANAIASEERFLHWFLAFPEVLDKGGFDCVLGNPPYKGDRRLKAAYGEAFLNYIRNYYTRGATVDLVVYFLLRIDQLLAKAGFLSIISTNTIAQGKAREEGLQRLLDKGCSINHAVRSTPWPGKAAVEVSLLTVHKGQWVGPNFLGSKSTSFISSYLDDQEDLGEPYPLMENEGKSFIGTYVLGGGFVIDPSEAERLMEQNPKNRDVIYPYLNGDDLNSHPEQKPSRYVINFQDWPLRRYESSEWSELTKKERDAIRKRIIDGKFVEFAPPDYKGSVAADYPDCLEIVEERVKPERTRWKKDDSGNDIVGTYQLRGSLPTRWWRFAETRPALYQTIAPLERVLVVAKTTKYTGFTFVPSDIIYTQDLTVFAYTINAEFAVLISSFCTDWAWKNSTTMGSSTIRLNPQVCYETFVFPPVSDDLNLIGREYLTHRNELNKKYQVGLTRLYNLLHDSKDETVEIVRFRHFQQQLDLMVLEAYGWSDINLCHDFYEVDYLPENDRVRFTIHPDARKEVLKRLLLLNHKRRKAEEEQGLWEGKEELITKPKKASKSTKGKGGKSAQGYAASKSSTYLTGDPDSVHIIEEPQQKNLFDGE